MRLLPILWSIRHTCSWRRHIGELWADNGLIAGKWQGRIVVTDTQRHIQIPVHGMHCAGCRARIEEAMVGEGVLEYSASLMTRSAIATIDPATTNAGAIADRIREIGYEIGVGLVTITLAPGSVERSGDVASALLDLDGVIWVNVAGNRVNCEIFSDYASETTIRDRLALEGLVPISIQLTELPHGGGVSSGSGPNITEWIEGMLPDLPDWTGPVAGLIVGLLIMWGHESWVPLEPPALLSNLPLLTALTLLVYYFLGLEFAQSAWQSIKNRSADMYAMVGVASTAALVWSIYELVNSYITGNPHGDLFLAETALVISIVRIGETLQSRALAATAAQFESLLDLVGGGIAIAEIDGELIPQDVRQFRPGDIQVVRPGDQIALDGEVVEGESTVDESLITGESRPVPKHPGDLVIGSSYNHTGALKVKVSHARDRTILSQIVREVELTQSRRSKADTRIAQITKVYVPIVALVGLAAAIAWLILVPEAGVAGALRTFFTVLVVSCPCAIGLAIPAATSVGIAAGARNGILLRDPQIAAGGDIRIDVLLFDKTGTVTMGRPQVSEISVEPGLSERDAIAIAASVEAQSEHPIGLAIRRHAADLGIEPKPAPGFSADFGGGVKASVDGNEVLLGSATWLAAAGISAPEPPWVDSYTVVHLAVDGQPAAMFALTDEIRSDAADAIAGFKSRGVKPVLVSGDRAGIAHAVADAVGIEEVHAELKPAEKAELAGRYANQKLGVAMIGDGINDAPALAQADIGIAVGTGSDLATQAAHMSIVSGRLSSVADAIALVRQLRMTIQGNLALAFGSTAILIVLATGILYPVVGFQFSPALAAVAMAASTLLVIANSLRIAIRRS